MVNVLYFESRFGGVQLLWVYRLKIHELLPACPDDDVGFREQILDTYRN